ncbi:MAG: type II toxin-antitoxin system death-on-curing family toxin [Alphaproteobacteria bacterium]|nr:type II toxin-antitoxin system death-on-curing family toxin [Alphaproteobacteria bacterium]
MMIQYITIEQAIETHQKTIQYSGGGADGMLNRGQLESILEHIKNDEYYPTFVDKLTHLFFGACKFHCFEDGNKRIAITLCAHFLLLNGYMAVAKSFFIAMENISYEVASGKISKELLHRIITSIMDKTYDYNEELKLDILNAIQ